MSIMEVRFRMLSSRQIIRFSAIVVIFLACAYASAQNYTGKPFSATATNPVTGAPVHLYVDGSKVRADFLAPPEDPTAKDDLVYTLAFFEPRAFYQVSPHDHTCQSQPGLLTAKTIEEYLTGFTVPIDSIKSSSQGKLISRSVTVNGMNYVVFEPDNSTAGAAKKGPTGKAWILKDLGLVTKMEGIDKNGKAQSTNFLMDIEMKAPDPSLFAVPQGCAAGH